MTEYLPREKLFEAAQAFAEAKANLDRAVKRYANALNDSIETSKLTPAARDGGRMDLEEDADA